MRLVVLVLLVACGSSPTRLQPHRHPAAKGGCTPTMRTSCSGSDHHEPKCDDNPAMQCKTEDLECSLDGGRGCYACQCAILMHTGNADSQPVHPPIC